MACRCQKVGASVFRPIHRPDLSERGAAGARFSSCGNTVKWAATAPNGCTSRYRRTIFRAGCRCLICPRTQRNSVMLACRPCWQVLSTSYGDRPDQTSVFLRASCRCSGRPKRLQSAARESTICTWTSNLSPLCKRKSHVAHAEL